MPSPFPSSRTIAFLPHGDAMARQPLETLRVDLRRAVGAQHEIAAPGGELERQADAAVAAAVDRQRLIAHLPSVAVRTVEDAAAVQLAEAGNVGQVVDDAGGEEELAGVHFFAGRERDAEAAVGPALRGNDLAGSKLHGGVLRQLLARRGAGIRAAACRRA